MNDDAMTLPEKLVAAAAHPDSWDVRGLLLEAADMLLEHCSDLFDDEEEWCAADYIRNGG